METFYGLLAKLEADPDLSQDKETDLAADAAAWEEGGEVVNVKYTLDRYVQRRVYFLGQHPNWKQLSGTYTGLFPLARGIAEEIFNSEHEELTTLELRRREDVLEVQPLLPLTTTQNYQTIDDFGEEYTFISLTDAKETEVEIVAPSKTTSANTIAEQQASMANPPFEAQQSEVMNTNGASKVSIESAPTTTTALIMSDAANDDVAATVQSPTAASAPQISDTYGLVGLPVKNWSPEIMQSIGERLADLTEQTYPTDPRGKSSIKTKL